MEDLDYDEQVAVLALRVQRGTATPQDRKKLGELMLLDDGAAPLPAEAPKPEPKTAALREVAAPTKKEEEAERVNMSKKHDAAARNARLKDQARRVRELIPLFLETIAAGNYTAQSDVCRQHRAGGQLGNDVFWKLQEDGLIVGVRYKPYRLTLSGYARINRTAPANVQIPAPSPVVVEEEPAAPVARVVGPGTQLDIPAMVEKFIHDEPPPKPASKAPAKQILLDMDTYHTEQLKDRIKELERKVRSYSGTSANLSKQLEAAKLAKNPPPDWETVLENHKTELYNAQNQAKGYRLSTTTGQAKIKQLEASLEEMTRQLNAANADRDAALALLDWKTTDPPPSVADLRAWALSPSPTLESLRGMISHRS